MLRYLKIFNLIALLSFMACSEKNILEESDIANIKEILKEQQLAWNQGDIESFMTGYWNSNELRFISSGTIHKGWKNTLERYKSSYPNDTLMGKLEFKIRDIFEIESNSAALVGNYSLKREIGDANGYFTLIFRKINGSWKIISDMTCSN